MTTDICNTYPPCSRVIINCTTSAVGSVAHKTLSFDEYYRQYLSAELAPNHEVPEHSYGYVSQLHNWLTFIDRKKLFILDLQTLISDTPGTMKRLSQFLRLHGSWGKSPLPQIGMVPLMKLRSAPTSTAANGATRAGTTATARNGAAAIEMISCFVQQQLGTLFREHNDALHRIVNSNHSRHEPDFPNYNSAIPMNICNPS